MQHFAATWVAGIIFVGAAPASAQLSRMVPAHTSTTADGSAVSSTGLDYLKLQKIETDLNVEDVVVFGERATQPSAASIVRSRDLLLRPRFRPADILEVTPGFKVAQHSGGGKANQYFFRGFDADHGTDVALNVDGVPVNMVSHGHGQGYADLHFVIPELVDRLEIKKGPYYAEVGDFGTAGSLNLVMKDSLEVNSLSVVRGMFDTFRALAAVSPDFGNAGNVFAAEFYASDGPFNTGEDLRRINAFARSVFDVFDGQLTLTASGYRADWLASGQIPDREVRAGRLDRFGSIDPTEGGESSRYNGYIRFESENEDSRLHLSAYFVRYTLQLYSNFTFFSRDAVNGDQIEQTDERFLVGGELSYGVDFDLVGVPTEMTFGLQTRTDIVENGLFFSQARNRLADVVQANVTETSVSAYAKARLAWTSWLRTEFGVRGDFFNFAADTGEVDDTQQDAIVSPKVTMVISPWSKTDIFAKFGFGFHSNDARGVVRTSNPVEPLTRAIGGELGVRTRLFDRLDIGAAGFWLDLDSEIVFIGDEGTTEASGKTRRMGVEMDARLRLLSWLYLDADFTVTNARFRDAPAGEDQIPLAPRLTASGGLSGIHPDGYFGRLSLFHLADRPASEDEFITALGYTRVDATLGYGTESIELTVTMQNLLDADIREAQFATTSRLNNEVAASDCPAGTRGVSDDGAFAGCEDLHFTPGLPISVKASLSVFF